MRFGDPVPPGPPGSAGPAGPEHLLEVRDLKVHFTGRTGRVVKAVDGVSWSVDEAETMAIVGESGSGKSVSVMAILGLLPTPPATFPAGDILLHGRSVLRVSAAAQRRIRGTSVAMIFQDPLTSLNPVMSIGAQIAEMIRAHGSVRRSVARSRSIDLLGEVGIPSPRTRVDQYPHQFSGGMRQRAMIAMALANDPAVLLADEPTTALDVTVQAQIMALLERLQEQRRTAIVLITHDLGLVAHHAHAVNVMYAGRIVESGTTEDIFYRPRHAYTYGLLSSLTRLDVARQGRLHPIGGAPPDLSDVPAGCPFHPRCEFATSACVESVPELSSRPTGGGSVLDHRAACVHSDRVAAAHAGGERR